MRFDAIIDWKMDETEAQVYKIALIWEELAKKTFPNQKITGLRKTGDPRKGALYQYCWRLYRETKGLLKLEEYRLYVTAQLQILRIHNGRVEPNVLCGDAAWIRWKVWKRLYDQKCQELDNKNISVVVLNPKIVKELDCTKRYLFEKTNGEPTFDKIKEFYNKKLLKMWGMSSKISIYYLLLSPWIANLLKVKDLEKLIGFDSGLYIPNITDDIKAYFNKEFNYEFES